MTLSDRIVVMNEGKIDQVGTPNEVYRQPRSRFVADFIGRANFVQGQVMGREDGRLEVGALGARLGVPAFDGQYQTGQPVTLMIRPEMAEIEDLDERRHAAGGRLSAPGHSAGHRATRSPTLAV